MDTESAGDGFDNDVSSDQNVFSLPKKRYSEMVNRVHMFQKTERKVIIEHIQNIRELTKPEKDMYIMEALRVSGSTAKKNQDDIKRRRFCYCFNGSEICVAASRSL